LVSGVIAAATIVGIPYAISQFHMAKLCAYPFGQEIVETEERGAASIMSLVFFPLNMVSFLSHIIYCAFDACTVVGAVYAEQHLRLAFLCFSTARKVIPFETVTNPDLFHSELLATAR
jgi:uncharacterized membrane protein YccF (DUF307 family)